jgi:hypothetical protein
MASAKPNAQNFRVWYRNAKIPPKRATPQWYRTRGLHFERALYHLLNKARLRPRTGYRPAGEQIDGSFILSGRVFLLEAKWHQDPIPVSSIYDFQGKVNGTLVGTLGVFISMSGFASKAADALVKGKAINILLMDATDIDVCMDPRVGPRRVIEEKLRIAAETGVVYWPSSSVVVTATSIKQRRLVKK